MPKPSRQRKPHNDSEPHRRTRTAHHRKFHIVTQIHTAEQKLFSSTKSTQRHRTTTEQNCSVAGSAKSDQRHRRSTQQKTARQYKVRIVTQSHAFEQNYSAVQKSIQRRRTTQQNKLLNSAGPTTRCRTTLQNKNCSAAQKSIIGAVPHIKTKLFSSAKIRTTTQNPHKMQIPRSSTIQHC